ncbi:MAG: MlaD family protein [Kofleriaceae bacterium]
MRAITRLFTLLTVAAVVVGLVALVRSRIRDVSVGEHQQLYVLMRDGSRIAATSPVVIAGVRVGDIAKVSLEGRLARIDLLLRDDIRVPRSAVATRRADKLFGDSYIELIPGTRPDGPFLSSGDRILYVLDGSSADAILRGIDSALPKADRAMQLTQDAASASRKWISGPLASGLARAQAWLDEGNLEAPIARIDDATLTIEELTARAADALDGAAPEVFGTLDRIDRAIGETRASIASANASITGVAAATTERLAAVDPVLRDLSEAVRAVDAPDDPKRAGTLARLVNDRELADDLDEAATRGAEAMRDANRFRVLLGLRSEYDVFSGGQRFAVTADLSAHPGSFYHVAIERGPQGGLQEVSLSDEDGAGYLRTIELTDLPTFTAQWGTWLGPLALRGGLKSSTFGAGADLQLGERVLLSADVFGGSFSSAPNLKLSGAFAVFRSLHLLAGVDNALTSPGTLPLVTGNAKVPRTLERVRFGRDYFFGANVRLSEDDLAMLLRVYGAMLIGLL